MKRTICTLLALVLCVGLMPPIALADNATLEAATVQGVVNGTNQSGSGTYQFVSNESDSIELTDSYVYDDNWFTGSSYRFNQHLATLSILACAASTSARGEGSGVRKSENLQALLKDLGFQDIATNAYYAHEVGPNAAGCAIGHKIVFDSGKQYTLLAIIPRCAGYTEEWAGNFIIGKDGVHEGFKAIRDETLRFTRLYVKEHGVTGNVKIWVAGYSRGAGLANAVGAFMAQAGSAYLDGVTINPQDVYAYTFGTPGTIVKDGAMQTQVFSVEGARGGRYANDTPGDAFTYEGTGIVSPHEGVFQAVHNCAADDDIATLLPPRSWGFTTFGTDFAKTDGSAATSKNMLIQLAHLSDYAYEEYATNGGDSPFTWKTFDLATLSIVDDASATGAITQADFLAARVRAFITKFQMRGTYVDAGYEDVASASAGLFGLAQFDAGSALMTDENKPTVIKAAAFSYLAYASERLQAEGRAASEEEAIALAIEDALEWITNTKINPGTFTVDNLVFTLAKYLVDNADITFETNIFGRTDYGTVKSIKFRSKVAETVAEAVARAAVNAVPEQYKSTIAVLIPGWDDMNDTQKSEAACKFVFGHLNKMVYGNGSKEKPGSTKDASSARSSIYLMLPMLLSGDEYKGIRDAIGTNGSGLATGLLAAALPLLTGGQPIGKAADTELCAAIQIGVDAALKSGRYAQGSLYYNDLSDFCETVKAGAANLRESITYALFYDEGTPFATATNVRIASTLINRADALKATHLNETYIAWMRAQDSAYPKEYEDAVDFSNASIGPISTMTYTGKQIKPSPTVTYNGKKLVEGTDYTLTYEGNVKVGSASITITGKGVYVGYKTVKFTIQKASITSAKAAKLKAQTYTGKAIKPTPKLTYKGSTLKKGTDYTLKYKANVKAGTATITITGKGGFKGKQTVKFTIQKAKIASAKAAKLKARKYTGKAIKPIPKLTYKGKTLKKGTHFTLSYKNNKKRGTATIIVAGKGNFKGKKTIEFTIK